MNLETLRHRMNRIAQASRRFEGLDTYESGDVPAIQEFHRAMRRPRSRRTLTCDAAFPFRMGAGFPGAVNRSHPMTIESAMMDPANPVGAYGLAVLADAASPNGVRGVLASDSAITAIFGIAVRPFPVSPQSATNFGAAAFGSVAPSTLLPLDVLKAGYIMVNLNGVTAVTKGGLVYVYYGTSTGSHVQGGFEGASGANLIALDTTGDRIYWNGPADASGVAELVFNP
jgi:hypothetical protein